MWLAVLALVLLVIVVPGWWVKRVLARYSNPADRYSASGTGAELARRGCWVVLALLTACSEPPPQLSPLAPDAVLSFGDSLTYGTGVKVEESYPAQLAQLIGREVVRSGVPGEVSARGLARLPEELERHAPALLILCHGGNDLLRRQSITTLEQNLKAMIALARERGVDVLLIGVPQPAVFGLESAEVYQKVASDSHVPLLEHALPEILSDSALKSDQIHPNARGYRQLAQAIANFLRETGAVSPAATSR